MATNTSSFEPYTDFDAMSQEQAEDLRDAIRVYKGATEALAVETGAANLRELAADVLRASSNIETVANGIMHSLYVTPVMVHIAGERKEETNPDDAEDHGVVQRCRRCGSILSFWSEHVRVFDMSDGTARTVDEEEIQWWEAGEIIAKANTHHGNVGMYPIEPQGRPLEKHEHECADLSELGE